MKNKDIKLIKGENRKKGAVGENEATKALKKNGYKIVDRNFSCTFGEIDIIALHGDYTVFIEVKTRSSVLFGMPRQAVDLNKQKKIIRSAQYFLMQKRLTGTPCRFDVVEVTDDGVLIIPNAFWVEK